MSLWPDLSATSAYSCWVRSRARVIISLSGLGRDWWRCRENCVWLQLIEALVMEILKMPRKYKVSERTVTYVTGMSDPTPSRTPFAHGHYTTPAH